jgi:hypothetical protein
MAARYLVAAVGPEHQHPLGRETQREGRQHVADRSLVGPLQVVDEDGGRPAAARRGERRGHRLEQQPAVSAARRSPELGNQQRELATQRPAVLECVWRLVPEGAQRTGHGPVRRRRARHAPGDKRQQPFASQDLRRESRLPDTGFPRHQHQAAVACCRGVERLAQPGQLLVPTHQLGWQDHEPTVRALPRVSSGSPAVIGRYGMTVSRTGRTSSAGSRARRACSRIASAL